MALLSAWAQQHNVGVVLSLKIFNDAAWNAGFIQRQFSWEDHQELWISKVFNEPIVAYMKVLSQRSTKKTNQKQGIPQNGR